jgi:hypothetical protein
VLSLDSEREHRFEIRGREVRKIGKDLVRCHAPSEVLQNVGDRDPRSPDNGFAASHPWVGGDPLCWISHTPLRTG